MKHTIYFNTMSEMNEYFPNGVPNNFVAVVGDIVITTDTQIQNALFSATNNIDGGSESLGGDAVTKVINLDSENTEIKEANTELIEENNQLKSTISIATNKSEEIKEGPDEDQ